MERIGAVRERVQQRLGAIDDARTLMSLMLDCTPADVAAYGDTLIPDTQADAIMRAAERRVRGEPLAYCAGRAAFRDLVLDVDSRVLIPRPETEILVDEVLRVSHARPGGIAIDIGTGSGAIAIALATEGRFDRVIATDISRDALEVATRNASRYPTGTPIDFRHGADTTPLDGIRARVLASNPPYIAYAEAVDLPRSVRDWEPPVALFASDRGMAMYERLLDGAPDHLERAGWIVLEVDARRAEETAQRAQETGHYQHVRLVRDLTGRQRVLVAQLAD